MKTIFAVVCGLTCSGFLTAQDIPLNPLLPKSPHRPITRPTGGGTNSGVSIGNKSDQPAKNRYVTHVTLSESRFWQSVEGKTLDGKLLAFEDVVTEVPAGASIPEPPAPPKVLTVVKDGKVRLLVAKKSFEIPLSRLVKADQDFIEQIRAGLAKKAEVKP
jgi:hypothetical protein